MKSAIGMVFSFALGVLLKKTKRHHLLVTQHCKGFST